MIIDFKMADTTGQFNPCPFLHGCNACKALITGVTSHFKSITIVVDASGGSLYHGYVILFVTCRKKNFRYYNFIYFLFQCYYLLLTGIKLWHTGT